MDQSRRLFFKQTLGLTAAVVSAQAVSAATCQLTAAQTPGPFIPNDFPFRAPNEGGPHIAVADSNTDLTVVDGHTASQKPRGQIIYLRGQVLDQHCVPVTGANVYLWQADDDGHYNHAEDPNVTSAADLDPHFQYRGIAVTDGDGRFQFKTIKPKYYPLDPQDQTLMRTAHLHVTVLHPNCDRLTTQTYFEGDALEDIDRIRELNNNDIILSPNRRILPQYRNLVVEYRNLVGISDGPVGDLVLNVNRRA